MLRAAMDLADESGIDSLTMRGLGRRLGVEAASLYNHVAGKDDLFDGMVDLVVSEIDLPAADVDWKQAMRRRAISAREVFARHRWASGLIDSHGRSGPAGLSYADAILGTLLRAGFSPEDAGNAFLVLDSYIYGFDRQESNLSEGGDMDSAQGAELAATISAEAYPSLVRVAAVYATKPYDGAAVFEFGLGFILDGLERLLGSHRSDGGPA